MALQQENKMMLDFTRRLFVGIKISRKLQHELDSPAPGTEQYLNRASPDYLAVITIGDEKLIGRYLHDGFPAATMDNVSRNICSIVKLITRQRIEESSVHVYIA
jgi:hypothetical protein